MTFVGLGRLRRRGSGADPLGVSTKSRARVAVEPATFWAVHWYQAASDALARGMSSVEAPLSIVMCTSGPGTIGTPSWKQMFHFPSIKTLFLETSFGVIYSLFPTWYTAFLSTYNICYPLSSTCFRPQRPIIRRSKLYMQPVVFSPWKWDLLSSLY